MGLDIQCCLFLGIVDNWEQTKPIFCDMIAQNLPFPEINREEVCILEMGHLTNTAPPNQIRQDTAIMKIGT